MKKSTYSLVELNLRNFPVEAGLKFLQLLNRWVAFEKDWTAPPLDQASKEKATKEILEKLETLNEAKREYLLIRKKMEKEYIDYHKANAFLEKEIAMTEDPDDLKFLNHTRNLNIVRLSKIPLIQSIEQSMAERVVDFQIAEYKKILTDLGHVKGDN
jgi:hypothetical protein